MKLNFTITLAIAIACLQSCNNSKSRDQVDRQPNSPAAQADPAQDESFASKRARAEHLKSDIGIACGKIPDARKDAQMLNICQHVDDESMLNIDELIKLRKANLDILNRKH